MKPADVISMLKDQEVKFVDLRFADTKGKEQHVTIPARDVDEGFFEDGKMFDGSSIAGWKGINESDMILMPDASSAKLDVFTEDATVNIRCDVYEPSTMQAYNRCPRMIADTKMTAGMDLPKPLTATPERVAKAVFKAYVSGKSTIYTLGVWRQIMFVVRAVPEKIFVKTQL